LKRGEKVNIPMIESCKIRKIYPTQWMMFLQIRDTKENYRLYVRLSKKMGWDLYGIYQLEEETDGWSYSLSEYEIGKKTHELCTKRNHLTEQCARIIRSYSKERLRLLSYHEVIYQYEKQPMFSFFRKKEKQVFIPLTEYPKPKEVVFLD